MLNKNHITLKYFCEINNIKNYQELCDYCNSKNITPVEATAFNFWKPDFYDEFEKKRSVKLEVEEKVNESNEQKQKTEVKPRTRKTNRRRASSTRKKSKPRNSS